MSMTQEAIAAARAAGSKIGPVAVSARYRPTLRKLEITYDNGVTLPIPTRLIQGLGDARAKALADIEISPAGRGLHFPRIDADVYVPALLEGIYGTRAWMRRLGSTTSPAKAAASRENGKKGGRPRKPQNAPRATRHAPRATRSISPQTARDSPVFPTKKAVLPQGKTAEAKRKRTGEPGRSRSGGT